jgi:hypothetical protein
LQYAVGNYWCVEETNSIRRGSRDLAEEMTPIAQIGE